MTPRVGDTVLLKAHAGQPAVVADVVGVFAPFVWVVLEGDAFPRTYRTTWVERVILRAEQLA